MTEQEVFEKLLPLIREVTAVREEEIRMESNLMEDLGAASLDLLDLSFLIEETFGITLTGDEFERQVSVRLEGGAYQENGFLTEPALAELRRLLPEVPPEKLQPPLARVALPSVLNVAAFLHLIQRKLAKAQTDESCSTTS
jgi:acyl carrier protein